jgi:central kinetochore subunit Mal2/MCM21
MSARKVSICRFGELTRQLTKIVESLRHRRSLLANTLLSNRRIQNQLRRARTAASQLRVPAITEALDQAEIQANANLSNLYRTCSGATAFRVQDPDPNAVDSGKVLGFRIDVFSTTERRFITPYYVLLNQPENTDSNALKIHKHTIPPFIPLEQLAAKYLPLQDSVMRPSDRRTTQNLPGFVRALRRELVSYHKRLAALKGLKTKLGSNGAGKILDPSGKEFEMELSNGSVARITLSIDGKIDNAAVRARTEDSRLSTAAGKRQTELERAILGGNGRIEELQDRLTSYSAS